MKLQSIATGNTSVKIANALTQLGVRFKFDGQGAATVADMYGAVMTAMKGVDLNIDLITSRGTTPILQRVNLEAVAEINCLLDGTARIYKEDTNGVCEFAITISEVGAFDPVPNELKVSTDSDLANIEIELYAIPFPMLTKQVMIIEKSDYKNGVPKDFDLSDVEAVYIKSADVDKFAPRFYTGTTCEYSAVELDILNDEVQDVTFLVEGHGVDNKRNLVMFETETVDKLSLTAKADGFIYLLKKGGE